MPNTYFYQQVKVHFTCLWRMTGDYKAVNVPYSLQIQTTRKKKNKAIQEINTFQLETLFSCFFM